MRKTRLLIACFIAACSAVFFASPATADEIECPPGYLVDFVDALVPPLDTNHYVTFDAETIVIRGDNAVALAPHYVEATLTFAACLEQDVAGILTPYVECVLERSEAIRTSPDPVARYVEVSEDLVVTIHRGLAEREAAGIFNCNGIVTYGG